MRKKKSAAAVALGRKGGEASARKLTDKQRREKARKAARAKWGKDKTQGAGRRWVRSRLQDRKAGKLTGREHEVAAYAARGRSNSEIARLLGIGVNTVKKHIGSAFVKLAVANRTELAVVLMKDRNDSVQFPAQLQGNILGAVMLKAAKEAYEMAEFLEQQGQPNTGDCAKQ